MKRQRLSDGSALLNAEQLQRSVDNFVADLKVLAEEEDAAEKRKAVGIIKLNVGGRDYVVDAADIHRHGESMLAAMFSGRTQPGTIVNGDAVFIKRNGAVFQHVVDFLIEGSEWQKPKDPETRKLLIKEAQFYNLSAMLAKLQAGEICSIEKRNLLTIPGTSILFLRSLDVFGCATIRFSNKRSFACGLHIHVPESKVCFGIMVDHMSREDGIPRERAWVLDQMGKVFTLATDQAEDLHWRNVPSPFESKKLTKIKLSFKSEGRPHFAYCLDDGDEVNVTDCFEGADAIPAEKDMCVYLQLYKNKINCPVSLLDWEESWP